MSTEDILKAFLNDLQRAILITSGREDLLAEIEKALDSCLKNIAVQTEQLFTEMKATLDGL